MLDPKFVRENSQIVKEATLVKRVASPELVDIWLKADAKRRNTQTQFDALRNEQKKLGELFGKLKRELKADTSAELEKLIAEANAMKVRRDELLADLAAAESDCQTTMLQCRLFPILRGQSEGMTARTLWPESGPILRIRLWNLMLAGKTTSR